MKPKAKVKIAVDVLMTLGILVIGAGAILMTKKRKHNES